MAVLGSSGNPGKVLPENLIPQFARPEFSVFQSSVSSSIAVTTYLIGAPCVLVEFFDDGDAHDSFVEMSIKSTKESEYRLFLARDYGVMPRKDWKSYRRNN